jgi:hypothetical protein
VPPDRQLVLRSARRSARRKKPQLAVGRHEIVVVSRVTIGSSIERVKETRLSFEVVPGSLAPSSVKLVRGRVPDVSVNVYPRSGQMTIGWQEVDAHTPLAARWECFEGEASLGQQAFIASGTGSLGGNTLPPLSRGHHVLRFRFTPDVGFAYDNDVTETLGETFERVVEVDAP